MRKYIILWSVLFGYGTGLFGLKPVSVGGIPSYSLQSVAGNFGMKFEWVERGESIRLSSQWTELVFKRNDRSFLLNGQKLFLGTAIQLSKKELWLSELDFTKTLQPLLTPQVIGDVPRLRRIVIDPGHGGKDPGTMNEKVKLIEKHLALDVARRLAKKLKDEGYEVFLTREDDNFVELKDRATWANEKNADLFISIHFNAAESPKVSGLETFAYTPVGVPSTSRTKLVSSDHTFMPANAQDEWNMLVAFYFHRALLDELKVEDRGVKRARFGVLKYLKCPGVLVESGFLSHPREGRNIGSAAYRDRIVDGVVQGVAAYARTLKHLVLLQEK